MKEKQPVDQQIIDFLKEKGAATVDDICEALKISRTSARKYLAGLTVDKKVHREEGGREGRRKLPDVFSQPGGKQAGKQAKRDSGGSAGDRLRPGELDKHVLGYMRQHTQEAPHSPSAIAKGIARSAGAVANCLARMDGQQVRLVQPKPRRYGLAEKKKK
jgi:hypothetical protein